ncbi:Vps54-like protein-domain-containing protein [Yarrowia lipolytica]|uniref:Vps54-like protein-domain-containing protein n=1 Tax=Yarrowia lipolytica TaxID=4952 RepID=A0A371CDK3_YARLL|nr:Vps54-like protein-domain-containing protein [Yarrowia lipolytica]RDW35280.1 Vps54-like protein-domain-containing protein [Yarrowia lipolytica]RDW48010.1 Vps54-like protein-domain-containing protein [Yarrowia lipolytica]RDW54586.1 Vps54-like protein-domain-containing protein [Yarrowia lipolytica]
MSRLSVSSSRQSLQLGSEDLGPNAIGSLVEATEGYKPPTIKDIEQVKLPSIARVSQQKYNEYLQEVQQEYRQYCQLKRGGSDVPGDVNSSLDSVPQAFFEPDFRLDNQRIFDTVTEHKTDVTTYNILQEKLSYYIDTVEVNLIEEISKSSDSFFMAIDELKQIHSDTESAVEVVRDLRTQMQTLDQINVERGLQMVQLQQQYAQVEELENGVTQLQEIVRLFQEAERLSEEQPQTNLLPCLELVDSTDALIHGDSEYLASTTVKMKTPISNLSPLTGLKPLRDSLLSLRVKVGHKIGKQFTLLLIDDLQSHGQAVPTGDTIVRLMQQFNRQRNRASPPEAVNTSFNDVDPAFRGKLASLLNQLLRAGQVQDAFKAYQDAIADYSRRLIKQHLPSSTDTNSMSSGLSGVSGVSSGSAASRSERGMALAGKLRALSASEFENTLAEIYASLSEFVRRLLTHQKLLLDLISSQPALLEQCGELAFGLRQVISGTVDKQLAYMTKIVNARREQTAQLPCDLFLNFYALNGIFVRECEQSVGVVSNPLQTTLVGHLKQFIQTLFNRADEHLLSELEKDKWKDTEISAQTQQKVDDIVAAATQDPIKWKELLFVNLMGGTPNNTDVPKEGKMRPKNVFVEAASFIIPNGTTHLVDGLVGFLQLVVIFPGQTPELVDVITSLIKRYNVSANELILQAGATRSAAKLAHISAKNLALVSQSLGFIVTLIPYMREYCRRHVTSQQIPAQFDRTKRDLLKHQDDIHTKLVSIMVERMVNHSRTLRRIDWSKPVTTANGVHEYMQQLISDTNTLSKSLKKVLASENYIGVAEESKLEIPTGVPPKDEAKDESKAEVSTAVSEPVPEVKKDVEGHQVESKDDAKKSQTEDVKETAMELNDTEMDSTNVEEKTKEASEEESREESKTGDVAVEETNSESQHVSNDIVTEGADAESVKVEPGPENADEVIASEPDTKEAVSGTKESEAQSTIDALDEAAVEEKERGDKVGDKVEDKVEDKVGDKVEEMKGEVEEGETGTTTELDAVNSENGAKENGTVKEEAKNEVEEVKEEVQAEPEKVADKPESADKDETKAESETTSTPDLSKETADEAKDDGKDDKDDSAPSLQPEPKPASISSPKKKKNKKKGKKK